MMRKSTEGRRKKEEAAELSQGTKPRETGLQGKTEVGLGPLRAQQSAGRT